MAERKSYVLDEAYLNESTDAMQFLEEMSRKRRPLNYTSIGRADEAKLEMFSHLHLQAFQHEFQYGTRLDVCNSIRNSLVRIVHASSRSDNTVMSSLFYGMFQYADAASRSVVRLVAAPQYDSLSQLVSIGGVLVDAVNPDEDALPLRDELRQNGLTIERRFGVRVEITPTEMGARAVQVYAAREDFDTDPV